MDSWANKPDLAPPPGQAPTVQYTRWEQMQKHKPQGNSIGGGALLLLSTGIHLAWGLWSPFFKLDMYLVTAIVFHLGAIMGGLIGAIFVKRISKRFIYYCCAVPVAVGNILFITCYTDINALLAARLIIGLAHGCLYVVLLCHGGENAMSEMRGRVVATIGFFLTVAAVTMSSINMTILDANAIDHNLLVGAVSLGITLFGVLLVYCLNYESVVYLMNTGRHQEALDTMTKLRSESTITWAIQNDYDELSRYVEEQSNASSNIFKEGNIRPLAVVSGLRTISFITNNVFLNMVMIYFTTAVINLNSDIFLAPFTMTISRMILSLISLFFADSSGRKSFVNHALIGSVLLFVAGLLLLFLDLDVMSWLMVGFTASQGNFANGPEIMSHIVASEAFALNKKPMSIAFVHMVEHVLHILAFVIFFVVPYDLDVYYGILFLTAVLVAVMSLPARWLMPETVKMPLSKCRDAYLSRFS